MIIVTNSEVPADTVESISSELIPVFGPLEFRKTDFKSHAAASVIELLGGRDEWSAALGIAGSEFLSGLVKESATDLLNSRSKIETILDQALLKPLKVLTSVISGAMLKQTQFSVGITLPDGSLGAALTIPNDNKEFIAWTLSSFTLQADVVETVVRDIAQSEYAPAGRIQLLVQPDGGFLLKWMDKHHEKIHSLKI
jgi:hypothetical protein